ncbi:MAG: transglutaminase family protein [Phycisphaerae bacterium]
MKFQLFRGRRLPIKDLATRLGFERSVTNSAMAYPPDSVDAVMQDEQIWLNDQTAEYIYTDFTPTKATYRRGSRQKLEEIVERQTRGCRTPRAKALALMRFCRDIPENFPSPVDPKTVFFGGTEEEFIKKGSRECNEMARTMIVLCQIAGVPARYVGHFGQYLPSLEYFAGHGVVEAFVEGKWMYIDMEGGKFFIKPDGTFADAWELKNDLSLLDAQPKWVTREIKKGYSVETTRLYLSPRSITVVNNYSVNDFARYNYPWRWYTPALARKFAATARRLSSKHLKMLKGIAGRAAH